jgi:oligosaccharyltransferase complex subunit delta (ribophorin II)
MVLFPFVSVLLERRRLRSYVFSLYTCVIYTHTHARRQNMAKPPSGLPPTAANQPLHATLLLGSHVYAPASLPLFHLILPASHPAPVAPEEVGFHPLPEIEHAFRPAQKLPPKAISAVFAGAVFAPWPVLFFLVRVPPPC